jgi:hypothetical protein
VPLLAWRKGGRLKRCPDRFAKRFGWKVLMHEDEFFPYIQLWPLFSRCMETYYHFQDGKLCLHNPTFYVSESQLFSTLTLLEPNFTKSARNAELDSRHHYLRRRNWRADNNGYTETVHMWNFTGFRTWLSPNWLSPFVMNLGFPNGKWWKNGLQIRSEWVRELKFWKWKSGEREVSLASRNQRIGIVRRN